MATRKYGKNPLAKRLGYDKTPHSTTYKHSHAKWAEHEKRALRIEHKDLAHTYRHLTREEIDREYTPEVIAARLAKGNENVKAMLELFVQKGPGE